MAEPRRPRHRAADSGTHPPWRRLGEAAFRREFCCSFESLEGLVFPNFARCVVPGPAPTDGRRYGGIDFGFRNPFAAVWGILDKDGTLWLTGEHYDRQRPLSYHATKLPRGVTWYADPAGAGEIAELRAGNRTVIRADNAIRPGLARISARLEAGKLKIEVGRGDQLVDALLILATCSPSHDPISRSSFRQTTLNSLIGSIPSRSKARRICSIVMFGFA